MTLLENAVLHPEIDIRKEQEAVCGLFTEFYASQGYQSLPSAGLLPQEDHSVLFTGATITPLKKFLEKGVPQPGICMVQKCLRTKRLEEITDLSKIPDWTHYFTMCGILAAPGQTEAVAAEVFELLTKKLKINPGNLLIEAASGDRDLSTFWSNIGIEVVEDTQPENYYHWQYGLPGISGRGINLQLKFNPKSPFRDLGNIISVQNSSRQVIAYEFGFGLESLLATKHGFKKPMEASLVSAVIPYQEGPQEKFIDALMAAVVIFHHGIEPGRGKEKHVLKKLVKGLSFLRRRMALDFDQIKDWCEKFEIIEFGNADSRDKLINGIMAYEQQLAKFIDYSQNQVHAHQLRNELGGRLLDKIKRQGGDMGILPIEIEEVVRAILS